MQISDLINTLTTTNWLQLVGAVTTLLLAAITIFEAVPGDQPEKSLRKIVTFLEKFSRK